jgi:hypothetical protein
MSKFLLKDKDGSYRKKIESLDICKYRINEICCNENSKYYRYYPYPYCKCENIMQCKFYQEEHKLTTKFRR